MGRGVGRAARRAEGCVSISPRRSRTLPGTLVQPRGAGLEPLCVPDSGDSARVRPGLCSVQAQRPQTVLAASLRTGDVRWGSGETCLCVLARSAPRQAAGGRELPERCIPFPRSSQAASGGRVEGEPPGPGPDAPVPALLASVLLRASLQATRFWLCWMPPAPPHRFLNVFLLSCPMLAASGSFLGPLPQMPSCLCSRR